jgi:hypothetical protein
MNQNTMAWLSPIHFLCLLLAGWINSEQLRAIEYLQTESAVLRELLGKQRLRLTDDQRRRLAVKGKTLGRSRLAELATIAGITASPDSAWMCQIARNLVDNEDGFLRGKHYLLMDRDGKYCPEFRAVLRHAGVNPLRLPARSPNLNAFAERFARSIKEECLDRMIFFGEKMLRQAVSEFCEHYRTERDHQGIGNRLIKPADNVGQTTGEIVLHERLGGLLKYYERQAA